MLRLKKEGARGILAALDKRARPWLPPPPAGSPDPAFLTQLPTVTDDDMYHITSTCIRRGSASGTPACSRLKGGLS